MREINCDMCMDLIPLVKDGIASEESRKAVEEHMETCDNCREIYGDGTVPPTDTKKVFGKLKRKIQLFSALLLVLGIVFGLGLTASSEMFYNSLIMPFIGVLGYVIFRWKSLYLVPMLLVITHCLTNLVHLMRGTEHLDFLSLLVWTGIYSVFVGFGFLIAWLVHFSMRKEELKSRRAAAFLAALAGIAGLGSFANGLVGNPVSEILAKRTAEKYLAETYADTDFYIDHINYDFKVGSYFAYVESKSSIDSHFPLYISMMGKLERDDYEQVLNGWNTYERLNTSYRESADSVLKNPQFPKNCDLVYADLEMFGRDCGVNEKAPIYGVKVDELKVDGLYDIQKLGLESGKLTIYMNDENVTAKQAAKRLLEVKRLMDEGGVAFYAVDFVLEKPKHEKGTLKEGERIEVMNFLCRDIYEEGLAERVKKADEETAAQRAQEDEIKSQEEERFLKENRME